MATHNHTHTHTHGVNDFKKINILYLVPYFVSPSFEDGHGVPSCILIHFDIQFSQRFYAK